MNSPAFTGQLTPDNAPPSRMIIGPRRADGRYKVVYIFPLSGRRFTHIRTLAKVLEDQRSGHYTVTGFIPDPVREHP